MRIIGFVARLSVLVSLLMPIVVMPQVAAAQMSPGTSRGIKQVITFCPGGDVFTPRGCVPQECSFGPAKHVDTATQTVILDDGTSVSIPGHCLSGSPVLSTTVVYSDGTRTTTTSSITPSTNGWVEDAKFYHCFLFACDQYYGLSGSWPVPSAPSHKGGQLIFLFTGMTTYREDAVIQSVLQWGTSAAGGGNYWAIASWWATAQAASWSQLSAVNVGDNIAGTITSVVCGYNCRQWTITTQDTSNGGQPTTLVINTCCMYNNYATLEARNVQQCADYPASSSTRFSNLVVNGGTPGWGTQIRINDGCGENVVINQQGNPGAVTLFY